MRSDESLLKPPAGSSVAEEKAKEIVKASLGDGHSSLNLPAHHDVREEAAALFAAGETRSSISTLLNEFNRKQGNVDKSLWYLLLDIYQAQNDQAAYEKLAEIFANQFKTSPPAWESLDSSNIQEGRIRNALVIDGSPSIFSEEKNKDYIKASKQGLSCRLDLSRMRLDEQDKSLYEGLMRLCQTMAKLRLYRVKALLMGETALVQKIYHDVEAELLNQTQDKVFWLFLLECLQWRGEEEKFEELAIRFAVQFEVSPPGYEKEGAIANHPSSEHHSITPFNMPSVIDEVNVQSLFSEMDEQLGKNGNVELDFKSVKRMTFESATQMADFLKKLKIAPNRLSFKNITEILSALFDITGIKSLISATYKKR